MAPPCFPAMVCGRNDDSHAVLQRATLDVSDLHCHLLQPKSHPTTQRPTQSLSYPATQTTIHSAIRHIMQPPTRLTPHPATQLTSHTASYPAINQETQFLATVLDQRSWRQVLATSPDHSSRPQLLTTGPDHRSRPQLPTTGPDHRPWTQFWTTDPGH